MDVSALYPSIRSKRAGYIVRKAAEETSMSFDNVDYNMALRYLSKSAKSQEEVNAEAQDLA